MSLINVIPLHVCYGSMKNYSYILTSKNSKNAIIIDPAWEMQKYIDIFNLHSLTPTHILLTHSHYDHINLVDNFIKCYEPIIWISKRQTKSLPFSMENLRFFSHLEELSLGDFKIKVFLTPGHTPESSCFLIDAYFFSGDTLFIEGCGMCGDCEGNPGDLYESLMYLKRTLPLNVKIYPGHRYQAYPGQTFDYVLKNNLYLHIEDRHEFIKYRMRENQQNLFNFK